MTSDDLQQKLLQYINEARSKPALMAAKFSLLSEIDPTLYNKLFKYASELLDVLSEIDNPGIKFSDIYTILSSPHNDVQSTVKLSLYMYKLRTGTITDSELEDQLANTFNENSVKELICKGIASLYCEHYGNAFAYLSDACEQDVHTARSILSAFTVPFLNSVRSDLVDAREKHLIPCSCGTGVQNHGFRVGLVHAVKTAASCENLAETSFISNLVNNNSSKTNQPKLSFQLCRLHRLISEFDDVIRLLQNSNFDRTPILRMYLDAGRSDFADMFMELNERLIDQKGLNNFNSGSNGIEQIVMDRSISV
eukprot:TCONS_00008290-protein